MAAYSPEDLERIARAKQRIEQKRRQLIESLIVRNYPTPRAREFALHGFGRRFSTLKECIDFVFHALPPESAAIPSDHDLTLATIAFQAHLINLFGCLDNLAWLWVEERGVTLPSGQPLPERKVGMGQSYKIVRNSFPDDFRNYLVTRDQWFSAMEKFRHALAHRIAPYIPPYSILPVNLDHHQALDAHIREAIQKHQFDFAEDLKQQQAALRYFRPCITHSFEEEADFVVIHPQMLSDFNTVEEMARRMLLAL